MRLELWSVLLCKFLWIDFLPTFFLFDLFTILIYFLGLWRRLLWRDVKDLIASRVANRIAVENIASILAIVLAQPPAESLAHHLLRNLLLAFVILIVRVDLALEVEGQELVLGAGLVLRQLLQLALVGLLPLV